MEEAETCTICFNQSMVMANGSLVCTVCGTQSQAFTEEVNDAYESGLAGARTKRVVTFKTTRVDRAQTERHHSGALVVEAYSKALQDALLVLCRHLCSSTGVNSALPHLARKIWFQKLAQSKVLEPDFTVVRREELGPQSEETEALTSEHIYDIRRILHKELHPEIILLIIFLASVVLREALTPMELLGGCLSGALPFFLELNEAGKRAAEEDSMKLDVLLTKIGVPGLLSFLVAASELASDIQLALPPVNLEALLHCFCGKLDLPMDLCAGVVPILETLTAGGLQLHLWPDCFHNPYAKVMAMLVLATRLWQRSSPQALAFDWTQWAYKVVKRETLHQPPGQQREVVVYYPPDEARKALLSTVFAGQHVEPEFKEMHQMISHISALLAPKRAQEFRDQNTAGEAGSSKALTEQQKHRLLTVAAASVVWVKPDYLETLVTNMETELLKIERIASYLAGSPA